MAVRGSARRRHFGQKLFGHFVQFAQRQGCRHIKAITTPTNLDSIAFHKSFGMQLLGEANAEDIPIVRDYSGHGEARVVFWKAI